MFPTRFPSPLPPVPADTERAALPDPRWCNVTLPRGYEFTDADAAFFLSDLLGQDLLADCLDAFATEPNTLRRDASLRGLLMSLAGATEKFAEQVRRERDRLDANK